MQRKSLYSSFIFCILFGCSNINYRNKANPSDHRDISIVERDKIVSASIITTKTIRVKTDREYYWYYNNKIESTHGGYYKYLLDGEYIEFYYPSKTLKIKGKYSLGLMHKKWVYWYENGQIKEISNWKNGLRDGETKLYDYDGKFVQRNTYNKGMLIFDDSTHKEHSKVTTKKESQNHGKGSLWDKCKSIFNKKKKVAK